MKSINDFNISLIAAMAKNSIIGKDNALPWHIPEDFKYFKKQTLKKPVIMGRKTYESIGRLLPKRKNIIVTRKLDYKVEGAIIVNGIEEAILSCDPEQEVMIIGGAEIYKAAMPYANKIYLTIIEAEPDGDTYFPLMKGEWVKTEEDRRDGNPSFSFNIFKRG